MEGKAAMIVEYTITHFVDNQPKMLKNVPESVNGTLLRNTGNLNFVD